MVVVFGSALGLATLTPPSPADDLSNPATLQRESIVQLRAVGAVFEFDKSGAAIRLTFTTNRVTDEDLAHLKSLDTLDALDFNASNRITDRGFQFLKSLPKLRSLNLGGTRITDDGLAVVTSLKQLETLHLWLTGITDRGLEHVSSLRKLETLNLWDAMITDEGLSHLERLTSLRRLCIGQSQGADLPLVVGQAPGVTAAGVARLQTALPKTKIFHWSRATSKPSANHIGRDDQDVESRVKYVPHPINDLSAREGHDWPSFLGPTGDSKSPLPPDQELAAWPATGPRIVWQRPIGDSHTAPAIRNGRLFFFDRVGDMTQVTCLNSETGELLWKYRNPTQYVDQIGYGDGPRSSPVVDGDRVYAYGADGMLYCLLAATGREVWRVDTVKKFGVVQYFFGVGSTPVVEGDLLIAVVGGSPPQPDGAGVNLNKLQANGTAVVAFDKLTGEVQYQSGDALASYATPRIVTHQGRRWCFVYARGKLLALDPQSGKVDCSYLWKARFPAAVSAATPVVVDDQVFISECYGPGAAMLKFGGEEFEIVWRDDLAVRDKAMQTHWNTSIHHRGSLYGCSGRHAIEGDIRCLDWKTGDVRWSHRLSSRGSLLQIGESFICLDEYGGLRLFRANPAAYEEVSHIELKEHPHDPNSGPLLKYPCWTAPVVARNLMYVRGKDRLVCIELPIASR